MRLAYVCADAGIPVFGNKGGSIHIREVINALCKRGVQVELFAVNLTDEPPKIGTATIFSSYLRARKNSRCPYFCHKLPALSRVDKAALLEFNAQLGALLEGQGHFDIVYERYSLWSYAAMEYAARSGARGILEVNAPLIEEAVKYRKLANSAAARNSAKRVFSSAKALIAVSEEVAGYLRQYPGINIAKRVFVVPNGINPERFRKGIKPALEKQEGWFSVGFVGSFKPWHGLANLIEAFAIFHSAHPKTRLIIVGDGPERPAITQGIKMRGLQDAVHMAGAIDYSFVPAYLASMDVGAAPYPQLPGFYFSPLKVYEYMAGGLAVVASSIGQLKELIRDGHNGLLCAPGDSQGLAAALNELWKDAALRRHLGEEARKTVLKHYTWDKAVEKILQIAGEAC